MRLVDDHVTPVELFEDGLLFHDDLVRRHAHVPLARHDGVADDVLLSTTAKENHYPSSSFHGTQKSTLVDEDSVESESHPSLLVAGEADGP